MSRPFDENISVACYDILHGIAKDPPSDRMIDLSIVTMIREFIKTNKTSVEIWNFYKHILDLCVRDSLCSGQFIVLLDLELFYSAPVGGYAQNLETDHEFYIDKAPWRNTTN